VNTSLFLALPLWVLLAGTAPTPPPTLILRDGRVLQLKDLPHTEGARVVFTTIDGKTYSLEQSEVKSLVTSPPTPTRAPRNYNPQDSRALGAIARQERAKTGKTTDLSAPHPTPRATRPARPRPTPARPAKTPSPKHSAAKTPSPAPR